MKPETSHMTDGRDFNFPDYTNQDDLIQSLGGDAHNAAASINGSDSSYLLGLDNDYLLAPFESGNDIFAFRGGAGTAALGYRLERLKSVTDPVDFVGSPSPPESQEQSPKSINTSPNSSESSPPQIPGIKGPDGLTMMNDVEDDFPMLDEAGSTVTFPLSSSSNGFFGSNFTPLGPAPTHMAPSIGMDKMAVDDTAKFFDFESAASSPLAVKIEGQRQSSVPRFFTDNPTLNPQVSFNCDNMAPVSTPTYSNNRRKRRSSVTLSPNSTEALASFTFDSQGHPSPASSTANGISQQRNGKRHNSTSTSGEEEAATLMKSTGFRPTKAFSISNMWSPSSFSSASPMPNMLAYTPTPTSGDLSYKLTLRGDQPGGRINEKSRVETQIRVNLNLAPLPPGVTKLHLPTHTISKPKLLSKPLHQKTADTLELYTSLICASSVEGSPELLQKVLRRAIDDPLQERVFGSGKSLGEDGREGYTAEEDKPLNGGEVRICSGCITRERKRAARKKIKKVEEEESWARDESKRIIVFNCSEILEWGPPEAQKKAEMEANDGELVSPIEGNAEIWLPMRIACYCRHQSEKSGFRIILTIKDHNDNLIAQNITPPILITDDHKTNAPSQPATQQPVAAAPASKGATSPSAIAPGPIPVAPAPPNNALPYSASDTNLLSMGQIDRSSKAAGRTSHSRQNSRQSSVGAMQSPPPYSATTAGPSAKKRKANPSSKARSELTMTKIDTSTSSTSASQSQFTQPPFTPSNQNITMGGMFEQTQPAPFTPSTPMENGAGQNYFGFHNRNHSIDSLHGLQIFSAPTSAQASRVPSRVASPVQQFSVPQGQRTVFTPAQFAQVQSQLLNVANGQLSQALLPFDITRIVPTEGPCQGGIEVTILGSGFQRSHTVYFGDKQSPRTEYWSDTTIVCLLPPSSTPGSVPVVMRYAAQANLTLPGRPGRFIYTDDTEQKMLALALQVINAKWSGKIEPPKDIAMRLLMDEKSPGNGGGSVSGGRTHSSGGGNYHAQALQFLQSPLPSIDMEAQLLKLLDIIDMDDSPFPAKLNLRNRQGQTMLHLACSLGYSRFTAALLARGANPDAADKGGFTPTHFAVLKCHKDIVRRLRLNKADLSIVSLSGVAPEDLTDSDDIRVELGIRRTRSRRPSISSVSSAPGRVMSGRRSRSESIASAMANWEPFATHDEESDGGTEDDDEVDDEELWIRPKRTFSGRNLRDLAAGKLTMIPRTTEKPLSRNTSKSNLAALADGSTAMPMPAEMQVDEANAAPAAAATAAALVAIREQLANLTLNLPNFHNMNWNLPNLNLQNFQQQMHLNLQNLQGQTARFNALLQGQRVAGVADDNAAAPVPPPPPPAPQNIRPTNNEGPVSPNSDYKWWELFSPPNAPPAYEELYPDGTSRTNDGDTKLRVIGEAVAQVMDAKVVAATAVTTQSATKRTIVGSVSSSSSKSLIKSKTRRLTVEEEETLRLHHEKMKRIKGDQRLLFFWLPILVLILFTMLTNWGSKTWIVVRTTYEVVKERMAEAAEATAGAGRRVVEVGGL